ncbi:MULTISPECIES: hypothetical protein [Psychrilyobacter]|uniref:Porin n=1 Tax=Psychrilyobacter piezotolerans TaxID=2293438 RepID=A0ABX9KHA5_9FUSO|nr:MULTISPECIES: hypothetical protein [Psychrilyobacter]MCS5420676.1 hypothetical protein [Psychrilyobacter sp. S5]NDI77850.1 hypothetical protein [Psychrilyobacter piezotolerans]RDE62296.1 hypothetical protein DV867_06925 [Psychrilyobacter sp. S5]REI41394.1 hypothetical protein DYH56_06925 [Psychrilyobacter piezotolerans]
MKIAAPVILFLAVTISIFSLDLNTELKYQGFDSQRYPFEDEAVGRIVLKDDKQEHYSFFLEYRFGDGVDRVDAAQLKFMTAKTDLEIGRNRIGWGTGYNFNPTDIFNDLPLGAAYDPTYVKRGRDSIILTRYIKDSALQGIYAAKDGSDRDEEYGIKYKTTISEYDIDLLYIHKGKRAAEWGELEDKDDIIGGDLSFSIPYLDYGIWLEGAYYLQKEELVYITGIDNYFREKYRVVVEYLYHGLGEGEKENYNINRILAGQLAGRNYLMPSLTYEYSEKLILTGYSFVNMDDYSYSLGATITYFYNNNIDINLIPFYIGGKTGSEYGILAEEIGNFGITAVVRVMF